MSYVLFISESKLKDSTALNLNVDVNLLLPYVRQAQKLYVETKLGTDLNNKLKDLIVAGTVNLPATARHPKQELLYLRKKVSILERRLEIQLNTIQKE